MSTYELTEFKAPEGNNNCPAVLLRIVAAEGKTCNLKLQYLNVDFF
jgi:hypothetical protein